MSGSLPRQYIPTALHSELTEYSSLLRALRTNSILDVSHHLTQHGRADDGSASDDSDQESHESSSASDEPATGAKRKRRDETPPFKKRDKWTRWPLLLNDLHKPPWSFQDEIAIIASQALKLFPPPAFSKELSLSEDDSSAHSDEVPFQDDGDDQHEDLDMDVDDPDHQSYLRFIAMSASSFLSNVLMLLSSNTPPRPPSMQNRIEPLDWRSVLEIVSVYGDHNVVDERIINNVKARMEKLYDIPPGSSFPETADGENLITYRLRKNAEAKQRLESMVSQAYDSLFTLAEPPPEIPQKPRRPKTRARGKVQAKGKGTRKAREKMTSASSDESEEQPPLASKKRTVTVRPRPAKKRKVKSKKFIDSDDSDFADDIGQNVLSSDAPLCHDPIHEPLPMGVDSVNAEEAAS